MLPSVSGPDLVPNPSPTGRSSGRSAGRAFAETLDRVRAGAGDDPSERPGPPPAGSERPERRERPERPERQERPERPVRAGRSGSVAETGRARSDDRLDGEVRSVDDEAPTEDGVPDDGAAAVVEDLDTPPGGPHGAAQLVAVPPVPAVEQAAAPAPVPEVGNGLTTSLPEVVATVAAALDGESSGEDVPVVPARPVPEGTVLVVDGEATQGYAGAIAAGPSPAVPVGPLTTPAAVATDGPGPVPAPPGGPDLDPGTGPGALAGVGPAGSAVSPPSSDRPAAALSVPSAVPAASPPAGAPAGTTEATEVVTAPPPPPGRDEPFQQLVDVLRPLRRFSDGSHRLSVRLHPAELGVVHLELSVRQGTLSLHALADNAAAREALQRSLPDLRRELLDAGVLPGSLEIGARPGGGDPSGGRGPDTGSPAAIHRRGLRASDTAPVVAPDLVDLTPGPLPTRPGTGRLDLRI